MDENNSVLKSYSLYAYQHFPYSQSTAYIYFRSACNKLRFSIKDTVHN
jgi:hypothetical protein